MKTAMLGVESNSNIARTAQSSFKEIARYLFYGSLCSCLLIFWATVAASISTWIKYDAFLNFASVGVFALWVVCAVAAACTLSTLVQSTESLRELTDRFRGWSFNLTLIPLTVGLVRTVFYRWPFLREASRCLFYGFLCTSLSTFWALGLGCIGVWLGWNDFPNWTIIGGFIGGFTLVIAVSGTVAFCAGATEGVRETADGLKGLAFKATLIPFIVWLARYASRY